MDSFNKTVWKDVMQRFNFNIDQMEAKYKSRATSGMVYNVAKDKMEFDPEHCGAGDEETHVRALRREMNTMKEPEGRAIISTPYLDPQEKDPKQITRHAKMNQLFKLHRTDLRPEPYKATLKNLRPPSPVSFNEWRKCFRGAESSKTPGQLISTLPSRLANDKLIPKPNSNKVGENSTERFGVNATIQPKSLPKYVTQQSNGLNQSLQSGHINRRFMQVNRDVPRLRAPSPVSFSEWRKSFRGQESSKSSNQAEKHSEMNKASNKTNANCPLSSDDDLDFADTSDQLVSILPARLANAKLTQMSNTSNDGVKLSGKICKNATTQMSRLQSVKQPKPDYTKSLEPAYITRRFIQTLPSAPPVFSRQSIKLPRSMLYQGGVKARNRGKSVTNPMGITKGTSTASKNVTFSANATLPITVNEVSTIKERIQRYDSLFAISQEPVTDSEDNTNSAISFVDVSKVESIEKESFICSDDEDYCSMEF